MPKVTLNHFEAALLFALFTSIVFGVVTTRTDRDRVIYGVKSFGYFLLALFAIGWLMFLSHG